MVLTTISSWPFLYVETMSEFDRNKYVKKRIVLLLTISLWLWLFLMSVSRVPQRTLDSMRSLQLSIDHASTHHTHTAKQLFFLLTDMRIDSYWKSESLLVVQWAIDEIYYSYYSRVIAQLPRYDVDSDDSITKFVSKGVWYSVPTYAPARLTALQESQTISFFYPDEDVLVHADAYNSFKKLSQAYYRKFYEPLIVTSAWRSYEDQDTMFDLECKQSWLCAYAGYSEHQSWLAIDLARMVWKWYDRMSHHAHKYWFHQSYQKWIDIDNYHREDRHRRYLWVDLATELYESNQTFTQRVADRYRIDQIVAMAQATMHDSE